MKGQAVAAAAGYDSQSLAGACESGCNLVHGTVTANGYNHVGIALCCQFNCVTGVLGGQNLPFYGFGGHSLFNELYNFLLILASRNRIYYE